MGVIILLQDMISTVVQGWVNHGPRFLSYRLFYVNKQLAKVPR